MIIERKMEWRSYHLMNPFTNAWDYLNKKFYSQRKNVKI